MRAAWGSFLVFLSPVVLGQASLPGFFDEVEGRVIIEAESIGALPASWQNRTTTKAPDLSDPGAATGGDFIIWEGGQSLGNPGNGLLVYPIRINTPGEYRFCWRSQVSNGTSPTDHNDSWLKIDSTAFFGRKSNGNVVCPKEFDAQEIFARFDAPGLYAIRVSARSSFHALDRFTLSTSLNCEQDLELPESPF